MGNIDIFKVFKSCFFCKRECSTGTRPVASMRPDQDIALQQSPDTQQTAFPV
jgi:hypothetical protein